MFRYVLKKVFMTILILLGLSFVFNTPANAEAPSTTVASSHDASDPDNLQLSYMVGAANCDDIVNSNAWTSTVSIANLADTTNLSVSIEAGKGGVIAPQGTGSVYVHGNGFNPANVTLSYAFGDYAGEQTTFVVQPEQYGCQNKGGDASSITCYLNNYTDPSVVDEHGGWPLGTTFNLVAQLTDPDSRVKQIVFSFMLPDSKGNDIQSAPTGSVTWTPAAPGNWTVVAQLFDANGNEITPAGDCNALIKVVETTGATTPPSPTPTQKSIDDSNMVTPTPPVAHLQNGQALASAKTLPYTGSNTGTLATIGILSVLAGVLFIRFGTKRNIASVDPLWSKFQRAMSKE